MGVSRKEFDELKTECRSIEVNRLAIKQLYENMATLTRQIKCGCENFEVLDFVGQKHVETPMEGGWSAFDMRPTIVHTKHCLDCGWTTTYDTEEEALADKQELLDKQIDALKEQKKSLKK